MSEKYRKVEERVPYKCLVSPTRQLGPSSDSDLNADKWNDAFLESIDAYKMPNGQVSGRWPQQSNKTIPNSKSKTDMSLSLTVNRFKESQHVFYSNKTRYTDSDTDDEIPEFIESVKKKNQRDKPNSYLANHSEIEDSIDDMSKSVDKEQRVRFHSVNADSNEEVKIAIGEEMYTTPNGQVSGRCPPKSNETISNSTGKSDRPSGIPVNRLNERQCVFKSNRQTDIDTDDEIEPIHRNKRERPKRFPAYYSDVEDSFSDKEQGGWFHSVKSDSNIDVTITIDEDECIISNGQVSGRCPPKPRKNIPDTKSKTDRSSDLSENILKESQHVFYSNRNTHEDSDTYDEIYDQSEPIPIIKLDKAKAGPIHDTDVKYRFSDMSKGVDEVQKRLFYGINVNLVKEMNIVIDEGEYTIPIGQVSGRCLPKSNKNIPDSKSKTDKSPDLTENKSKKNSVFYSNRHNYIDTDTDDRLPTQKEHILKGKRERPKRAPFEVSKRVVNEQGNQFQIVNVDSNSVNIMGNGVYKGLTISEKSTFAGTKYGVIDSEIKADINRESKDKKVGQVKKLAKPTGVLNTTRHLGKSNANDDKLNVSYLEILPEEANTTGNKYIQPTRNLESKSTPLTQCIKNVKSDQHSQNNDSNVNRDSERNRTSSTDCTNIETSKASNEQVSQTKHFRDFITGRKSYFFSFRDEIIKYAHTLFSINTDNLLQQQFDPSIGTFEHHWRLNETGSISVPNCVDIKLMEKYFIVSADNKIRKQCRISEETIDSMTLEGAGRMCCIKKSARIAVIQTKKYISCLETDPSLYVVYRIDMKHQYNSICHLATYENCGDGLPNPMHVFATTFTKRKKDTGQLDEIIMQIKPKRDTFEARNRCPVYTEESTEIQLPSVSKICSLLSVWRGSIYLMVGCYDSVACIRMEDKTIVWTFPVNHSATDVAFMDPNILVCVQDEHRIAALDYKTGKEVIKNILHSSDNKTVSPHKLSVCGDNVLMKGYSNDKWRMLTVIEQIYGQSLVNREHTILK